MNWALILAGADVPESPGRAAAAARPAPPQFDARLQIGAPCCVLFIEDGRWRPGFQVEGFRGARVIVGDKHLHKLQRRWFSSTIPADRVSPGKTPPPPHQP